VCFKTAFLACWERVCENSNMVCWGSVCVKTALCCVGAVCVCKLQSVLLVQCV
jgi:hypothetical protein